MWKCIISNFLFLISYLSFSQQFGGIPSSLKWKQINSDTARVVFPRGLDSEAQRVANIIHYLAQQKPVTIGAELYKINIVLQNQTTISNGYVSLAPYRSEFFLTPVQNSFDLGSTPWAEQLSVHEYRHVQQFNNFRHGISKALYYILGEEGLSLGISSSIPDWFFEGDAVYNETLLTNQGRGRLPSFLNQYKSLWIAGKKYSWMKMRNGSFREYVPSHYPLGYLLVNYGYEKYGLDFWRKVTRDASAFKGLFYPFQKAIKRYAGVEYRIFTKQALDHYKGLSEHDHGAETGIKNITNATKNYLTNYFFPFTINDDSLLYLKSSYRRLPAFYIRDRNGEHKLRIKDISLDEYFSYRNGNIVYAAYQPDTRWSWRDYSVIRLLHLRTGVQRTVTSHTKYFSPDISNDGSKIVAVNVSPGGTSEIHILDAVDGKIIQRIRSAEIALFTEPRFIDDSQLIAGVRLKDGRMALAVIDINIGSIMRVTPLSFNVVGYPSVQNGVVYFTATYSGNDDLFALRLMDKKIFQLTSSTTGNYFVNSTGDKFIFSSFTAQGFQIKELDSKQIRWNEMNEMQLQEIPVYFPVAEATDYHDILLTKVPHRKFPVNNYDKSQGLFNFHSWRPYYEDPEFTFSIFSDNILNTFSTEIFYRYNQNENTHGAGFNAVYGGWFPYISIGMDYTFDRPVTILGNPAIINEWQSRVGLSVPLNFTKGKTYKFLSFGSSYVFTQQMFKGSYKDTFGNTSYTYLTHFISWTQSIQQARQHIFPRLGYDIFVNYRHAVTNYDSYQFLTNGQLFLPGVCMNHNLVFAGAFQQRDTLNVIFSNRFANSRGYREYYFSRMWRLSANYHLPIFYPDWGFANLIYFLRVRANAFYDFTKVYSKDKSSTRNLRSIGTEIFFDTRWWNQLPISFGVRYSRLLDNEISGSTQNNVFEIVVPVSIIPR